MNNTLTTKVIQNVFNVGGSTACDAGTQYCEEGYVLYFPCLKDFTRGQEVCFDFYIGDASTKDVVDLRDVDAISLDLNGLYGCSFGTFSYPDNISSLQTEVYPVVYENDFSQRKLYNLNFYAVDMESNDDDVLNKKTREFYSGTEVSLSAYDTPTHIFVGWANLNVEDDCPEETWEDYIFSNGNEYRFIIDGDTSIIALYRPRKHYNLQVDIRNKSSFYYVNYNNADYFLSHRKEEYCNGDFETLDVLEGYNMMVECIPISSTIDSEDNTEDDYTYKFSHWADGYEKRFRLMKIGYETGVFESGNNILLMSYCDGPVDLYELDVNDLNYEPDEFDEEGIHINTEFSNIEVYEYYGDEYIKDVDNVYLKYIDEEGFLLLNYGSFSLSSMDIDDGIKVNLYAKGEDDDCEVFVTINGLQMGLNVGCDEFKLYEFIFRHCDKSDIIVSSNGNCLIDKIEICKEEIIDKGKANLCLDAETTANLPTGPLSVSGAIMVNGHTFGIANTPIGNVNKLNKITIK